MLAKDFMMIGVNLRNQRRLAFVIESAYHMCCGDFQDFLHAVTSDGVQLDEGRGAEGALAGVAELQGQASSNVKRQDSDSSLN